MSEEPKKAMGLLGGLMKGLLGNNAQVKIEKPKDDFFFHTQGIDNKIALKHLRNMIDEILNSTPTKNDIPKQIKELN